MRYFLIGGSDLHIRHFHKSESRRKHIQHAPDFNGEKLEWNAWKTQLKSFLCTSGCLEITIDQVR